jgi:hypothetical protein
MLSPPRAETGTRHTTTRCRGARLAAGWLERPARTEHVDDGYRDARFGGSTYGPSELVARRRRPGHGRWLVIVVGAVVPAGQQSHEARDVAREGH